MLNLVLVDDHPIVLAGLVDILRAMRSTALSGLVLRRKLLSALFVKVGVMF